MGERPLLEHSMARHSFVTDRTNPHIQLNGNEYAPPVRHWAYKLEADNELDDGVMSLNSNVVGTENTWDICVCVGSRVRVGWY